MNKWEIKKNVKRIVTSHSDRVYDKKNIYIFYKSYYNAFW